jgi:ketosteroid isomerase-like protein
VGSEGYGVIGLEDRAVATIRAIYDAFARRDVEAALAYIAEDAEIVPEGTATLVGRTEPYRGHDGVRAYFADAERVWDELTLHAEDIRGVGGSVVVFGHVSGVVSGARHRRRVLWTWKVRDGRAISMRVRALGD